MSVRRSRISCRTLAMSHEMVHPAIWKMQVAAKNINAHSKEDGPLYLLSLIVVTFRVRSSGGWRWRLLRGRWPSCILRNC